MSVKDEILKALVSILDGNSQGEKFSVAIDMDVTGSKYAYFSNPNYYTQNLVEYTPAVFDVTDTPSGIPKIDKTTYDIDVTFALTGTRDGDTNLESEKAAIEEFRKALVDNPTSFVTVGSDTYNYIAIPTALSRVGELQTQDGMYRLIMNMGVTVISGIGLKFGGYDEKFEIKDTDGGAFDWTELDTIKKLMGTNIDYYSDQSESDTIGFSVPRKAIWQGQIDLTYNDSLLAHRELYDLCVDNTDFTRTYDIRITKPNTVVVTKTVNIQGTVNQTTGNDIRLFLTMQEV